MSVVRPREVPLGGLRAMTVRRTLPNRERTTIGAWCFIDHFGPNKTQDTGGMSVAPHPHSGLQTVSWLFAGEVEHRDSVGSHQFVSPGQLNLMTAGSGIAHSEVSTDSSEWLHGVQLWVALPDAHRHMAPFFEHVLPPRVSVPTISGDASTTGDAAVTVFVGQLFNVESRAAVFSPLVGAEILLPAQSRLVVPVDAAFEHGVLVDRGTLGVNDEQGDQSDLMYVSPGAEQLELRSGDEPVRALLLGGVPFGEQLVMWWNFIGRSHEEIVAFREAWQSDVIEHGNQAGTFGHVAFDGVAIPAPDMPKVRLRARG